MSVCVCVPRGCIAEGFNVVGSKIKRCLICCHVDVFSSDPLNSTHTRPRTATQLVCHVRVHIQIFRANSEIFTHKHFIHHYKHAHFINMPSPKRDTMCTQDGAVLSPWFILRLTQMSDGCCVSRPVFEWICQYNPI